MRGSEKWHVLDVGTMFGRICDNVVDIMILFPPTLGKPTNAVYNETENATVDVVFVGDPDMTCVVVYHWLLGDCFYQNKGSEISLFPTELAKVHVRDSQCWASYS
jgi:hypothetical protein